MSVALAKAGRCVQPDDGARPAAVGSPSGLSAHAQSLWLAAVQYRRLADDLARGDAPSAGQ